MAISKVLPRHTMKNRTRQRSMKDRLDYDQKPAKTNDGEWVSSYMCSPETAAEEFEMEVEEITSEIVTEVLKEVRIYPGGRLEIIWNLQDELEKLVLTLQGDHQNGT